MEGEQNNSPEPEIVPAPPEAEAKPLVHTYQDDMGKAMDATEASTVQELLATAREREYADKDRRSRKRQRGWYTLGSIILIVCALAALAYGTYYYMHLTVPVEKTVSVGVFATTDTIIASETDIRQTIASLSTQNPPLAEQKPFLVQLVTDQKTQALLNNAQLFSFIEATPTEPLAASISVLRLGVMNTGVETVPFIVASVNDPVVASKEFLIAEPTLVQLFYKALNIDLSSVPAEAGSTYTGEYRYNLPVRSLYYVDPKTNNKKLLLLYGYATDHIVVITTQPAVLKAVYDSIISQQ